MNKIEKYKGAAYAPLGIYVHIPFCIKKCNYCDFVSAPGTRDEKAAYVDSVIKEIEEKAALYKDKYYVDTIFFGGGTPTCLDAEDLIRIESAIGEHFVCGCINARMCQAGLGMCDGMEITFEANPATFDEEKLLALMKAGFNRISIGVQSFDDGILKTLGRIHDSRQAEEAVKTAKKAGLNTNLDLMFGVPGQSLEIWKKTLEKAISLKPEHLSFYSLQIEEGTPFYDAYRYGDMEIPTWEENRQMYHLAVQMLKEAGYLHYEISNACMPGFQCRHNMKYWSMDDYLGIGTAAHSYMDGKRTDEEESNPKADYIFTRLRLIKGFPKEEYTSFFGRDFMEEFDGFYDPALLIEENGKIHLTEKGLDYTNPVMARLLEKVEIEND